MLTHDLERFSKTPTAFPARLKHWRSTPASVAGRRSGSQGVFRSIQSRASTSGRGARSARWSDRHPNCTAWLNPHPNKNPAARLPGRNHRATGLKRTSMDTHSTSYPNFQSVSGLLLVDGGSAVPITAARRYIRRRYRICSEFADLIAVIAGLTGGQWVGSRLRGAPCSRLRILRGVMAVESGDEGFAKRWRQIRTCGA
jgi:hypothetical protein